MLDRAQRQAIGVVKLSNGETEGRDPREMSITALAEIGHTQTPLLKVIRAKCLDCSHTVYEVARCTAVDCPLWAYRMGVNPFRAERTEAQKQADAERANRLRKKVDA